MRLKVYRDVQVGNVVHPPGSIVEIANRELCRRLIQAKLAIKASKVAPEEPEYEDEPDDEDTDDTEEVEVLPAPKRPKKRSGDPDLHARLDELETH